MSFLILLLGVSILHAADGLDIPIYRDTAAVVRYSGFTLEYEEVYEQAPWVAYMLDRARVSVTIAH